jgi:hypothetical protein
VSACTHLGVLKAGARSLHGWGDPSVQRISRPFEADGANVAAGSAGGRLLLRGRFPRYSTPECDFPRLI